MGWGECYLRTDRLMQGVTRKVAPKSVRRVLGENTVEYKDAEGNTWIRMVDRDIVMFNPERTTARIFWERNCTGWIQQRTCNRIEKAIRIYMKGYEKFVDGTGGYRYFRKALNVYHYGRHRNMGFWVATTAYDPEDLLTSRSSGRYRARKHIYYRAFPGMPITAGELPNYQGWDTPWKIGNKLWEYTKGIYGRGVWRGRGGMEPWTKQKSCPTCAALLQSIEACSTDEQREELAKKYLWYNSRPSESIVSDELHFPDESDTRHRHIEHILEHVAAGEYPPELILQAVRINCPISSISAQVRLDPKKGLVLGGHTMSVRRHLYNLLVDRLGAPMPHK